MRSIELRKPQAPDLAKAGLAGLLGGLAGSWVMTQCQILLANLSKRNEPQERMREEGQQEEPATQILADRLSRTFLGRPLEEDRKELAGQFVHYGYGTLMGGVYGVLREVVPRVSGGAGVPYGAAMWLVGDEIAVPALKLSRPPTQYPLSLHAGMLAAHLVYGLTTDLVYRGVRTMIDQAIEAVRAQRPGEKREAPEEVAELDYSQFIATGA